MESNSETQSNSFINEYLTSEDIAITVKKFTSNPVKILNHYLDPYSASKLGFLGSHWNLKIIIQQENASDPEILDLFVKSMPMHCDFQLQLVQNVGVFNKESHFFKAIVPQLIDNFKVKQWVPKCYLAKPDTLVMENLRIQGYKILSYDEPLFDQFEMLKLAIATLARFHSCSILAEAHLSRIENHPVTLVEKYPDALSEIFFDPNSELFNWASTTMNSLYKVAEYFGYDSSLIREEFTRISDLVKISPTHRNVICHGDLWMNNIMFNNTVSPPKCVLVDYQVIRYAPLVSDIAQIFFLNSSKIFRTKYEKELIEYYHSVMEETVRNNDVMNDIKVPTIEEIMAGYEEWKIFGALVATMYFPNILLKTEVIEEVTKNSEQFYKLMTEDRSDFIIAYMKDNESFKIKVEEVITAIIEINKRLK